MKQPKQKTQHPKNKLKLFSCVFYSGEQNRVKKLKNNKSGNFRGASALHIDFLSISYYQQFDNNIRV